MRSGLEDLEPAYRDKERKLSNSTYLSTREGVAAVEEAVRVLCGPHAKFGIMCVIDFALK